MASLRIGAFFLLLHTIFVLQLTRLTGSVPLPRRHWALHSVQGITEVEDPQSLSAADSVWWGDSEGQERCCSGQWAQSARGPRARELPLPRPAIPSPPLLGTASRPPALQPDSSFLKGHLVTTKGQ